MFISSISFLQVYKYIFMMALFVSESMILMRLPKKEGYPLRLAITIIGLLLAGAIYPSTDNNPWSDSLMFLFFFLLSMLLSKWCYNITWNSCLFCSVAGYSIQHIASILYNMIVTLGSFGRLASPYSTEPANISLFSIIVFFESYTFIYFAIYFLFVRHIGKNEIISITSPSLFGLMVLMMLVEILLNALVLYRQSFSLDIYYFLSASITNMLCTICILLILFGQLLRKNLENELQVVNQLRQQEKRQYELSRETIDMINVKCHDMKHQIRTIRHSGMITNEALKEVEKSINIYDNAVKTGCGALDVILAEKSLFCQKNNISINCIVDGEKLNFINETDIYSLFGNLLDNALNSVMKLDEESRVVSLAVKERGQLLSVNIHNPYSGELRIESGIPQTTNEDTTMHGFGIKSIIMTVQKYGGTISFKTENGIFNVNILFTRQTAI